MGLAKINILFRADLKQFSSEIQNVSREMKKHGEQLQGIGNMLSIGLTLPVAAAGAASIKMASDYEESLNKVSVAFGSSAESVKAFAKDTLTTAGIAEGTALDMASGFGDFATSMGLPQDAAAKMSTSLVALAGDLASFKNIGIDQANTALSGIFSGETEALKRVGVVMTDVNLQAFALSKGITKQYKDFSQAEKVQLRYAYVMANTTNAQGDFVRTGSGAANQTRVFTESLKQLGQQFGAVILPIFTKVITSVNSLIKAFGELSPATRENIVIFAGIAASVGPLVSVYGKLLTVLPSVASAYRAVSAVIAANPVGLAIIGIQALTLGFLAYASSQKKVVAEQTALNDAIKKGNENAASEVASLDTLYKTSTNVKLSINERKKAVDELQALYPAYFKNIKDEAILNGTASASYKQLRDDIFNKARAIAVDNEIQKRANDRVIEETALREKILATEKNIQRIRTGADVVVLQEASAIEKTAQVTATKTDLMTAQYKLLKIQRAELAKFNNDSLKEDEALLRAKQDFGAKSSKLTQNEIDKQGEIVIGTNAIAAANDGLAASKEKVFAAGTVAFYEAEIAYLQKNQKETVLSSQAWDEFGKAIDAIQKKIDALTNTGVKLPKPQIPEFDGTVPSFSVGNLEEQKAYYEELRTMFSTTSDEYLRFTDLINNTQIKINSITGVEELKTSVEDVKDNVLDFSTQLSSTISSGITDFATGFAETIAGGGNMLEGFGNLLFQSLGNMMVQLGKAAIEIGVGMLAIKAAFKTPMGAILAGGALILAGTLFKSLPAFAEGGITGGTSYYGDKILARVNSGEMIANKNQQKAIYGMMNSSSNVNVNVGGTFRVSGTDLLMLIDRATKKKDRTG